MTVIVSHLDSSGLRTMSGSQCEIFLTIINKVKLHSVINTHRRPGQDPRPSLLQIWERCWLYQLFFIDQPSFCCL